MQGRIVRIISNLYSVLDDSNNIYKCYPCGKFRNNKIIPLVGDIVEFDENKCIINMVYPRSNYLQRPSVANIDKTIIVSSVKKPDLDLVLLDKLITLVSYNDITPIICFSKTDLLNDDEKKKISYLKDYYNQQGIRCYYNYELEDLKKEITNSLVVLAGQSGAGKSSLLNNLDNSLKIKTDVISEALGRGKHTTRHVELYEVNGGLIADTPGFSSLSFKDIPKDKLKECFIEFSKYECRFRNCLHNKEVDCKVKESVSKGLILQSRYDNYIYFLEGIE